MSPTNLPYDRSAEGPLLTVKKVMERLDCSRSFVYKLVSRGELRHIRLGDVKGVRVTEKSVVRYIRRRMVDQSREKNFENIDWNTNKF